MEGITLQGIRIDRQAVLCAMSDFDSEYHGTNDYRSWLEKANYKYAIAHAGRLYPCKHILSRASGIPTSLFNGGSQTNGILERLGFQVILKPGAGGRVRPFPNPSPIQGEG